MFTGGAVDLVHAFMARGNAAAAAELAAADLAPLTVPARLALGARARLRWLAPLARTWPQAMALGLAPAALPTTLRLLAELSDELWWHAGDRSLGAPRLRRAVRRLRARAARRATPRRPSPRRRAQTFRGTRAARCCSACTRRARRTC
jgi:hypothetical protein